MKHGTNTLHVAFIFLLITSETPYKCINITIITTVFRSRTNIYAKQKYKPIEQVWDALVQCVGQSVTVPANIQQLRTAMWKHSTGHNKQPDQLYATEMFHAA
jgi:hypothetical protein